jgi:hypothetical protein
MSSREKMPKGKTELAKQEPDQPERPTSSEKVMQTYRMPLDLVYQLKAEAAARGLDATAHVIRVMEGFHRYYGLPRAIVEKLEQDRRQMDMDKFEYFQHVLFRRSEAVQAQGAGFDRPASGKRKE